MAFWSGIGTLALFAGGWSSDGPEVAQTLQPTRELLDDDPDPPIQDESEQEPESASPAAASPTEDERDESRDLAPCDNLTVRAASTTCAFAQNVFWEYWTTAQDRDPSEISVYSAALGRNLDMSCTDAATIVCTTDGDVEVRIPSSALAGYTQSMADRYAASHRVGR
jgi:hypothetical protein